MDTGAFSVSLYARVLSRFGGTTNGQHIPRGKPWDRQPVSGKLRRKLGVSPGFAAYRGTAPPKRLSILFSKNGQAGERLRRLFWPGRRRFVRFLKRYWGWMLGGICLAVAALAGLMWLVMVFLLLSLTGWLGARLGAVYVRSDCGGNVPPNKIEGAVGAGRSAVAFPAASRRWFSFFR